MVSEQPRNTVDTMISAMPRNGRSARASAERRSFSVSGWVVLVNAKAGWWGVEIGSCGGGGRINKTAPNDEPTSATRSRNGTPICSAARGRLPRFRSQHRQGIRLRSEWKRLFDHGDLLGVQRQLAGTGILGRVRCGRRFWNGKHRGASGQET